MTKQRQDSPALNELRQSNNWGVVYILFDAYNQCCRIGSTKGLSGSRQQTQIGYLPHKVINFVNIEVAGFRKIEAKLHQHFRPYRMNGDWYNIQPHLLFEQVYTCLSDWEVGPVAVDFEAPGKIARYSAEASKGSHFKQSLTSRP